MEMMLTTKEYAEYTGIALSTVKNRLKKGTILSTLVIGKSNKEEYRIALNQLTEPQQLKYLKANGEKLVPIPATKQIKQGNTMEMLSAKEREEMSFWVDIIEKWQSYRNNPSNNISKAVIDERFIASMKLDYPELEISSKTLYRKWGLYRENKWEELVNNRGKNRKGKTKITKEMFDTLLYYYLDQAKHSVAKCYSYMKMSIKETNPEQYNLIPSEKTFRRHLKTDISEGLRIVGREGNKAYDDIYGFYIARELSEMASNEYWVGDTHTLDIQSKANDGSVHRLYLSAWMDVRSGIITGWHISPTVNSQGSILALRDGILRRGAMPENIYIDNGREYLTHDFAGVGHRGRKSQKVKTNHIPPNIIQRLGINMTNALVANARAKIIERRFRDFKEYISRLYPSYTGGNIIERPEILKTNIKNGNVIVDEELISNINDMIEYYLNYEVCSNSSVNSDNGKRKIDLYHELSTKIRVASEEDLNLMIARSTRCKKVGKRGVSLDIAGERFDYSSYEFKEAMFGKSVYLRYDPSNLSKVRAYDTDDNFIMEVPCVNDTILKYGAGSDDIKLAQKITRVEARNDMNKLKTVQALRLRAARELVLASAMENKLNPAVNKTSQILEIHRVTEEPLYQNHLPTGTTGIDLSTMNKNAKIKKENYSHV
ncbi:MAG: Mu transposase C-terminal domain-containing protein [bacterium]